MLETTGRALMTGDFELFAGCFAYPQELQTFIGRRILRTEEDLNDVFRAVRTHYMKLGVTELVRTCVEAAYKDDNTIEAVHETRLLSGTTIVQAAFPVMSTLRYIDGRWQVKGTTYAMPSDEDSNNSLLGRLTP